MAMLGRKHSETTIAKMKASRPTGPDHPNWKGGVTGDNFRYNSMRRERLRLAEGGHTKQQWEETKKAAGNACLACGKSEKEAKITKDHIVPISRGGSNYISNIQPLCMRCNAKKHAKEIRFVGAASGI